MATSCHLQMTQATAAPDVPTKVLNQFREEHLSHPGQMKQSSQIYLHTLCDSTKYLWLANKMLCTCLVAVKVAPYHFPLGNQEHFTPVHYAVPLPSATT